jgi:hypothetical protein
MQLTAITNRELRDIEIHQVYEAERRRPGYVLQLSPRHAPAPTRGTTATIGESLRHKGSRNVLDK